MIRRFNNRIRRELFRPRIFSSRLLSLPLEVARREACGIVVRQHYPRSRYALVTREGSWSSRLMPSTSIRRQHRYTITFQTRSGETRFDETRRVSPNLPAPLHSSTTSQSHSRTTSHPSVARHWLPREIDVISRGLCVITSLRSNESNSSRLEERISSSRFFSFLKETLLPRQRAGCQGGGRKRDTPRVSDVASNF